MNRRSFFQSVGAFIGAAALLPIVARAEGRRGGAKAAAAPAGGGLQLVDPANAQAKAVNYVEVNTQIKDKTLMVARSGVEFKNQKCIGCAFYDKSKEATISGKKAGPCLMPFATGKAVTAEGWCSSWAKKS